MTDNKIKFLLGSNTKEFYPHLLFLVTPIEGKHLYILKGYLEWKSLMKRVISYLRARNIPWNIFIV